MKKLILLLLIALFSCKTIEYTEKAIPAESKSYFLDFTKYTEKGFIFSSEGINSEYVPMGILSVIFNPYSIEKWAKYSSSQLTPNGARHEFVDGVEYIVIPSGSKPVDLNEALEKIYKSAIDVGANGVLSLKYNYRENNVIELTGTAVKILK